jgi:hypothetical protein
VKRNSPPVSPANASPLRGELVGDHALIVRDTIDTIADELFLAYTRDHTLNPDIEIPNRATLRALALEEACRRALARDPHDTRPARTQVHLVLHGRPLADGSIAIDPIAHDRDGCPWLLRDTAMLLCDASVAATVLDHLGLPTDSGRNHRVPGPRRLHPPRLQPTTTPTRRPPATPSPANATNERSDTTEPAPDRPPE